MKILTASIIENSISILNFKDAEANTLIDADLKAYLMYVRFLASQESKLLEADCEFTIEDLFYSRYYWFIKFKNKYFDLHGHDEGLEQEAFKMLENINICLENGIDWSVIECIDNNKINF